MYTVTGVRWYMPQHGPSYTEAAYLPATMTQIAEWAAAKCRETKADAIAACGHSGLSIVGAVSYLTGIPVIAVRKASEITVATAERVSTTDGNKSTKYKRWIILEDCISSGSTIIHIIKEIDKAKIAEAHLPELVLLYSHNCGDEEQRDTFKFDTYKIAQLSDAAQKAFERQNNELPCLSRFFDPRPFRVASKSKRSREAVRVRVAWPTSKTEADGNGYASGPVHRESRWATWLETGKGSVTDLRLVKWLCSKRSPNNAGGSEAKITTI